MQEKKQTKICLYNNKKNNNNNMNRTLELNTFNVSSLYNINYDIPT